MAIYQEEYDPNIFPNHKPVEALDLAAIREKLKVAHFQEYVSPDAPDYSKFLRWSKGNLELFELSPGFIRYSHLLDVEDESQIWDGSDEDEATDLSDFLTNLLENK